MLRSGRGDHPRLKPPTARGPCVCLVTLHWGPGAIHGSSMLYGVQSTYGIYIVDLLLSHLGRSIHMY